jgi:CheY-like chemotaxis protein
MRFEVWDTGIGIAAAELRRIFDEFVQVGNAERDRRRGLGLGLSIARRSGQLIGAAIDVASRQGRGSLFGFCQPIAAMPQFEPAAAQRAPAGPVEALAWDRARPVLIVDDDHSVRLALADLLGRWGVDFDIAADGEAALRLTGGGARYGLILADYRLPGGLDGLALIGKITACQDGAALVGVLITADFDPALIDAARRAGVAVLPKPVNAALLRRLLGGEDALQA